MKTIKIVMLGVACAALVACDAAPPADTDSTGNGIGINIDSSNLSYYRVRSDERRCAAPRCGGFFVRAVNRRLTFCPSGYLAPECYVADLDLDALGLSDSARADLRSHASQFLLRGNFALSFYRSSGNLGVFQAQEAWRGHDGTMDKGDYFRVRFSGIECVTYPCLSYRSYTLNSRDSDLIAGVDLSGVGDNQDDGHAQYSKPEGLMVVATPTTVNGPAGTADALAASDYFIPFTQRKDTCGSRNPCPSGQYCSFPTDSDCGRSDDGGVCTNIPSVCTREYRPVCGCDGKDYGNPCDAATAGVSIARPGKC